MIPIEHQIIKLLSNLICDIAVYMGVQFLSSEN